MSVPVSRKRKRSTAGTSPPASKPLLPFWNSSVEELSHRLFLPTCTDQHTRTWSDWNGTNPNVLNKTWFTARLKRYALRNPLTASEAPMEMQPNPSKRPKIDPVPIASVVGVPSKEPAGKARKIRLYPTKEQAITLNGWLGDQRWTFNQSVQAINNDIHMKNRQRLRDAFVKESSFVGKRDWLKKTPMDVRDSGMLDAIKAFDSNFAKKKKNPNHHFQVKFRSRKDPTQSIVIRGRDIKKGVFYPKFFGKAPIRTSEPLPESIKYDCRLVRTRLNEYYLCVPQPLEISGDNQARLPNRIVALDPGVRTFHTGYDPSGFVFEVGKNDIARIHRLCHHIDVMQSRCANATEPCHRLRYCLRRAMRRKQKKIRNIVDECHKKLVLFLVRNYSTILLPAFETSGMVIRNQRRIQSKTVRAMLTWSHYRFKQRLLAKTREYPWCKVQLVDESYTSKTCGRCGQLHHKLGGAKVFECPHCHVQIDRDINGARNILLKNSSGYVFNDLPVMSPTSSALGVIPSPVRCVESVGFSYSVG